MCYINGERRWWERVYDYFRSDETVGNRAAAVLAYLPKWKGFLVGGAGQEIKATEVFVELQKVVDGLTNSWVKESDLQPEKKQPAYFDIKKVK